MQQARTMTPVLNESFCSADLILRKSFFTGAYLMSYFWQRAILSSSLRLFRYFLKPGQKLMWNRQKRPMNDLGFLSYCALILQFAQPMMDSFILML